jgi:peroxiredoxin
MDIKQTLLRASIQVIFEGHGEEDGYVSPSWKYSQTMKKKINFEYKNWGKDFTTEVGVSIDKGNKIIISAPLWSGGIINIDVKKNTLDIHS